MEYLVALSVIAVVVVVVVYFMQEQNTKVLDENFGMYCPDCNGNDWMGESDCFNCSNCGWCIDPNGNGSCARGSMYGPLFKDCRSWYYNGQCMWGPQCGYQGPIYYDNTYWNTPWYTNWWYWGWGGPRRRYRRHHRRRRPWRRGGGRGGNMNRVALRRNMARRRGGGGRRGGVARRGGGMRRGGGVARRGGGGRGGGRR